MKKPVVLLGVLALLLIFSTMLFAAPNARPADQDGNQPDAPAVLPVAGMEIGEAQIVWAPHVENDGLVLTIAGPNGLHFQQEFATGKQLTLDLVDAAGLTLPDGSYNYELYAIPSLSQTEINALNAARENGEMGRSMTIEAVIQSGTFRVLDGAFVLPTDNVEREALSGAETEQSAPNNGVAPDIGIAPSAQVIAQDLIVQGSECVGIDCVNGESFGFDTLRLKENNLRIKFEDTSNSSSFPSNDWQLTANDSGNGGLNKFSIDDIDGGKTPFTLVAGAPSNSLYVNSAGNIGLGTSTPVVEMHVKDGDSPTLRLEQDGSSGFGAQTWDVAANETNFFIRDATNGSTLPFRIRPSAPSNSIYINTNGDVGMGTASPSADLDVIGDVEVTGTDGATQIRVTEGSSTAAWRPLLHLTNNGPAAIKVEDTDSEAFWVFGLDSEENGDFEINYDGGSPEFIFSKGGNLTITGSVISPNPPKQTSLVNDQQKQIEDLEARLAELESLVEALLAESN